MHQIDEKKVEALQSLAEGNNSLIIFMRHGVQQTEENINKIRMMQLPQNQSDRTTAQSLVDAAIIAKVLLSIIENTQKHLVIHSSKTMRAVAVAQVLGNSFGTHVFYDESLSSVNYRKDFSDEKIQQLLGNNEGVLPWDEKIVDAVCDSGKGTFESITDTVKTIFNILFVQNTVALIITHTQQINAATLLAGQKPFRLPQLGMIVFSKNDNKLQAVQFPHAIFRG